MLRTDLFEFYEKSYRDAVARWNAPAQEDEVSCSRNEPAYLILENAAMLMRIRDLDVESGVIGLLPEELLHMPLDERVRLVRVACDYAADSALPAHFSRILEADFLEPEEIEEIEHALCQIDELEAAVSLAAQLVRQELQYDQELLTKLSRTRCLVADLIGQLSAREDIVSVASRLLLVQRAPRYLPDGRPADWFTRFREWDREPTINEFLARDEPQPSDQTQQPPGVSLLVQSGQEIDSSPASDHSEFHINRLSGGNWPGFYIPLPENIGGIWKSIWIDTPNIPSPDLDVTIRLVGGRDAPSEDVLDIVFKIFRIDKDVPFEKSVPRLSADSREQTIPVKSSSAIKSIQVFTRTGIMLAEVKIHPYKDTH